jgi:putative membrane protein
MKKTVAVAAALLALTAALAATATASAPPEDENWVQMTISGDRFEIAGARIALARSATPATRSFAQRLIKDHSKSLRELVPLAERYGIGVPPSATPTQQWQLNRLKNMPKRWFDQQYSSLEIKDHNQDIEETGLEAREGQLYEVRMAAKHSLPMLNMHLKMAKRLVAVLRVAKES